MTNEDQATCQEEYQALCRYAFENGGPVEAEEIVLSTGYATMHPDGSIVQFGSVVYQCDEPETMPKPGDIWNM